MSKSSKTGGLLFALFHVAALLALLVYAFLGLVHKNYWRSGLILAGLAVYYFFVLHKPVREEAARLKKRKERSS